MVRKYYWSNCRVHCHIIFGFSTYISNQKSYWQKSYMVNSVSMFFLPDTGNSSKHYLHVFTAPSISMNQQLYYESHAFECFLLQILLLMDFTGKETKCLHTWLTHLTYSLLTSGWSNRVNIHCERVQHHSRTAFWYALYKCVKYITKEEFLKCFQSQIHKRQMQRWRGGGGKWKREKGVSSKVNKVFVLCLQ
jgi:hypothetical protein